MAAQYDQLGNYLGDWETEEERRKREEELANRTVSTQEITTYGDGTVERTTTEEMAPAIQPVAIKPVQQMPVAQPVSPETFQRMVQVESGGRDFTAQGQPVTSPKGALFAAQVMPQTAAQPGFGVRPAQAQTPEEYNRVGQEYHQAMLKQFGGDEQKAAAAYNAGPGRVQQAEAQAQQTGGSWTDYLPKETMQYLGKVFNNLIPSAEAGTLPQAPAQAQPQQTRAQQQMAIVTGQAQAQPSQAAPTSTTGIEAYQTAQDDPMKLLALRNDEKAPAWIRERAGARAYELMSTEIQQKQGADQAKSLLTAAAQGDRKASNTIARELQNQDGSWLKMILLGFISPQLAGEEAVKLGFGNKWTQGYDAQGNAALIQVNAKGLPLKGYDSKGTELSAESLPAYMTGGKRNLDIVGGTYVNDKTGEVGRVVTDKNTGRSYIQTDAGMKPMSGFRPQSSTGTLADMRSRAIQDLNIKLQGKGVEEQMQILRPYNQMLVQNGYPAVQPAEVGINVPQIGGGTAAPAGQAPQAAGPVAPTQAAAAPQAAGGVAAAPRMPTAPAQVAQAGAGMGGRPTGPQMESAAAGQKKFATDTAEDLAKVQANQTKNEQTSDYLLAKMDELITHPGFSVSVGATVQPYFQHIPGTDKADWYSRFSEVKGQTFLQAFETLRGGGQITEAEGKAATEALTRMKTSQSEKEFKAAADDFMNTVKRSVDRNRAKLGQEPKYGVKPETEISAEKREGKAKPMSAEDRKALEWVRNNPDDPRAAEIKRRLGL